MKRTKFILCALIGLFVGTSSLWAVDHVKGNGNLTSKKISIEDFNAIRFDGVIDYDLHVYDFFEQMSDFVVHFLCFALAFADLDAFYSSNQLLALLDNLLEMLNERV